MQSAFTLDSINPSDSNDVQRNQDKCLSIVDIIIITSTMVRGKEVDGTIFLGCREGKRRKSDFGESVS